MNKMEKQMKERAAFLTKMKCTIEKSKKNEPEGSLRVCIRGGKSYYYHRNAYSPNTGIYISRDNEKLAYKLAQKEYTDRLLSAIQKELNITSSYLDHFPSRIMEDVYDSLPAGKRLLVMPFFQPDQVFREEWEKKEYVGKQFREDEPEYFTDRGVRVRSKSELIIAEKLEKADIPYHYELPLVIDDYLTVYPDFTILHVKKREVFFWEHFGMMDDPDYAENAITKIRTFSKNNIISGVNLIQTFETKTNPLDPREVNKLIEHYFLQDI